ncbi:hypothetical protein SUNI508_06936 [Seiridium unicorne]|uniref:chitinase n=1 Tax=Seiridium unicorne TaxID=138068 RepID=A0ABR2UZ11_9PEZI
MATRNLLSSLLVFHLSVCLIHASVTHQSPERVIPALGEDYDELNLNRNLGVLTSPSFSAENIGLAKRQREVDANGALLCTDAPCVDGSCCGPDSKCGYGPDFCGDGCTSQCDATAMCGQYSANNGTIACGMNLCCSWVGWCGTSTDHCIGVNDFTKCQEGYGACEIIRPTPCGEDSGTTSGRTVGYYQADNVNNRICNRIAPDQIHTDGYTHLYYAFASIDPNSYEITAGSASDTSIMDEFTALKSSSLETWVAVGGFDFSDNTTATHTTWSDLCADAGHRASFISSTKSFMKAYGFQGIDLDWEYPVASDRGGQPEDTANFVILVKEMRESYGTDYGISLTLAPDYWYLRYFDAKAMEPYVDFFGFMAYDLHGSWDADTKTLGSLVRGQADVREIYNDTLPLFYDGLDPSKINFGLAWYGRGYTLAGPSKPGKCTNSAGVLSLVEIEEIIASKGLTPYLNTESMMKELVWGDQWIGYDDDETHALKRKFANNLCFGGTMAWSVDFYSGTGDSDSPPVSTDGQCGSSNGGTVCEGSGFGDCCSSGGWCGSTEAHCGSGCQSGSCLTGIDTTDGTCGAGYNNAICGLWPQGGCCSSSGYCGDTDAHCGAGCQSGPCLEDPDGNGSGPIYIGNTIYVTPSPTVQCYAPCTFIFPPSTMASTTTLSFAPVTTTLTIGAQVITTVLTPSPVTTNVISFHNMPIPSGDTTSTFALTSSLKPNPTVITVNGVTSTITFSAVSTALAGTTTDPVYYSLPTTVYTSGGVTQTFSEDQITTMSDYTATTTSTTTWTDGSSSSSSTTVVPIIIGPGGFYWSPVPFPTGPKFPIPQLPSPPPIPSPPCFKFLGIFSIDCPPNHQNPTTHFTSGRPEPTCTANCGTRDDPDDDESSTSTCATETNSVCRTTTGVETCNTYVGCDCVTSTVTDYWVTCSAEDSCSTTSSDVITGCFVTPTATTTGAYCPLPTYDAGLQEVGEGLPSGITITYATSTYPESVAIGSSRYTATSGTVVIGGSTVSLISVTVTTVITVGGTVGTLYPPATKTIPGYNNWDSLGYDEPSSTTVPFETPVPATSTTTKPSTTTTTSPTTTLVGGTPPAEPTAQLIIAYEWSGNTLDFSPGSWSFYSPSISESVDVCDDSIGSAEAGDYDLNDVPFPDGTIDFDFDVMGTSGCSYTGTSDAPGVMSCPDLTKDIQCKEQTVDELDCYEGDPQFIVTV